MPCLTSNITPNTYLGIARVENLEFKNLHFNPPSSGYHIIYNIPSGKKVLSLGLACANTTVATQSFAPCVIISGVNYRIATETSPGTLSFGFNNTCSNLYCSGESLGIYVTASGLNSYSRILEFNESANIKSIKKIDNWSSGYNILYTSPNKGTAILDISGGISSTLQSVRYFNQSTSAKNFKLYIVPNGESTDLHNAVAPVTTTIAHNGNSVIGGVFLGSGDSIYAYVDGSGHQICYCIGIEL